MGLLLLCCATLGGAVLVSLFDPEAPMGLRAGGGAALGLTLVSLLAYPVAATAGIGAAVWTAVLVAVALVALLALSPIRAAASATLRTAGLGPGEALFLAALGALIARAFVRVMFVRDGAIFTGVDHDLGDLPFHLGIVQGFARGANFWPEHPELAGVRLTYPFLADFLAALLLKGGLSLAGAITAENVVLAVALVLLLHGFAREYTGSRLAGALAPLLFLFSGGLGFVRLREAAADPRGWGALLMALPHDSSITWDGRYRWGNTVITLLMPQRSMLLGLPLALVVMWCWWRALASVDEQVACRRMALGGLAAGIAPLSHAHTFTVLLAMGACLVLLFPRPRRWAFFFVPALVLAVPQALWLAHGSVLHGADFVAWSPGWDHGDQAIVPFWLKNAGALLPLLAIALVWRTRSPVLSPDALRFYLPFLLCFIVPNLLRLSPWIWDNVKFLVFWLLASAPVVALLLARLWEARPAGRVLMPPLLLVLVLSGGLDVWRVASGQIANPLYSREAVAFADQIADVLPPHTVVASAPTYSAVTLLSGRPAVFGYPGHMWSQGLTPAVGTREQDLPALFGSDEERRRVAERYRVGALVVGPQEAELVGDEADLASLPLLARRGAYRLLDLRGLREPPARR